MAAVFTGGAGIWSGAIYGRSSGAEGRADFWYPVVGLRLDVCIDTVDRHEELCDAKGGRSMEQLSSGSGGAESLRVDGPQPVIRPVGPQPVSKIQHVPPAGAIPGAGPGTAPSKIKAFEQKLISGKHEESWQRSPNVTGTGAIHVKSFHCKLTEEALHYLDQQINEWLDAHPQYEVKFVTTAVGEWTGKLKEPNMIVQVWV
ncbi:MAG: hypothetical protein KF912_11015 [Phycisphaeraceae bacterium]|nr:hypothetical protein [Phycisphaeraceae bacterium]